MSAEHPPVTALHRAKDDSRVNLIRRIVARLLGYLEKAATRTARTLRSEDALSGLVFCIIGWRQRLNPGVWN